MSELFGLGFSSSFVQEPHTGHIELMQPDEQLDLKIDFRATFRINHVLEKIIRYYLSIIYVI